MSTGAFRVVRFQTPYIHRLRTFFESIKTVNHNLAHIIPYFTIAGIRSKILFGESHRRGSLGSKADGFPGERPPCFLHVDILHIHINCLVLVGGILQGWDITRKDKHRALGSQLVYGEIPGSVLVDIIAVVKA